MRKNCKVFFICIIFISVCVSACSRAVVSACPRVRVPACPRVRVSASPRVRVSACPRVRVSACPRVRGPRVRVSACPRVRVSACPRVRVSARSSAYIRRPCIGNQSDVTDDKHLPAASFSVQLFIACNCVLYTRAPSVKGNRNIKRNQRLKSIIYYIIQCSRICTKSSKRIYATSLPSL